MAINQLNKYVWLVETIHRARNRGGITLKEIQSRWLDSDLSEGTELSRRTFINNLHAIEELFEINIECSSGFRYHIEYGNCFEEGSTRNWLLNAFSLNAMVGNSRKLIKVLSLDETSRYLQISGALQVGEEVAYLDILYDVSSIYKEREELVHIYYEIFALLVVICGIVSYSNSFLMTRPLTKLARTSKLIAAGSLSSRSKVKTNDEIGQLSKEFDCMADQLEKNINDLKETMESQNQFIGNFTHELKTPMTSIIGYADLIRTQSLDEQEQIEAINYIYSEGKRLERLSLKLLDIFVTDNAEINLTVASPKKIVESVISNLQNNYLKKGISLSCKCEEGTCMLEPDLVRSLVINLIDNGRKAMTNGGHIYVQTTMTDKGCIIQVKDDGRGMPKDAIAHITEAFYRVDKSRSRQQGGAGLGLALCENIIKLHNGNINFKSKENVGTIVNVELKGGRE